MNDFIGSLAQQDVNLSTEVALDSTVGANFYRVIYLTDKVTRVTTLTKSTMASVLTAAAITGAALERITANLNSLFVYGGDVVVYLMTPDLYNAGKKYRGYFVYVDCEYSSQDVTIDKFKEVTGSYAANTDYYVLSGATYVSVEITKFEQGVTYYTKGTEKVKRVLPDAATQALLAGIHVDSEFSQLLLDIPFNKDTQAEDVNVSYLLSWFIQKGLSLYAAARGTDNTYTFAASLAYSPMLYQIGRTLGTMNSTGTPVANSTDMVSCGQADVLPNRNVSTEDLEGVNDVVASWLDGINVLYFKPLGNGTGNLVARSGWTIDNQCVAAQWMLNYCNFVLRVMCATVLSGMNVYLNKTLYNKIVGAISVQLDQFVTLGRMENLAITAPAFSKLPKSGGDTMVIPNAWEAYYVDDARKVKISGTLYVTAKGE